MFKNFTLGQYFPGNSPIHRLDPRTKILLMIFYIVIVFMVSKMTLFALCAVFVIAATLLSGIPLGYLIRSLRPLKWLLIFMFVLNVLLTPGENVLFEYWKIRVTLEGAEKAVFMTLRLILLVAGTSLMTLTTTPIALTDGLERLLSPLKKVRFPAHELAMMMTIALRFIPTLMEEADKIMKAQLARGADFETGGVIKRAKGMIPILVPLFISAFRRADELAMAMESRCYHGGEGRTRMRVLKFMPGDAYAALTVTALGAAVVLAQRFVL